MRRPAPGLSALAAVIAASAATAACGLSNAATTTDSLAGGPTGTPVTIGISLPLGGGNADGFAADGAGMPQGLPAVGQRREQPRRPARPPGQAENHRTTRATRTAPRPTTRADHPGSRGPDPGPVLLAAHGRGRGRRPSRSTTRSRPGRRAARRCTSWTTTYMFSTNVPVTIQIVPFAKWVVRPCRASGRRPPPTRWSTTRSRTRRC